MGQQQSSNVRRPRLGRRGTRRSNHRSNSSGSSLLYDDDDGGFQVLGDDEDDILDEKIRLYRQELKTLIADGVAEKHRRQYELNQLDNELYEKKLALHQLGEESKTFYSFWDYVSIVQSTPYPQQQQEKEERSTNPSSSNKEESRKRKKKKKSLPSSSPPPGTPTPTTVSNSEATMTSSFSSSHSSVMAFTIFGFFEAYLVRRLHLALLLQHQCSMQKKAWNNIIVFCYDEFPANKREGKRARILLDYVVSKIAPSYEDELVETVERLLFLQDKLIFRLRHGEERLLGFDYSGGYPVIAPSSNAKNKSNSRIGVGGGGDGEVALELENSGTDGGRQRRISDEHHAVMVIEAEYGDSRTKDDGGNGGHSEEDELKQNNSDSQNERMEHDEGEGNEDDERVSNVVDHGNGVTKECAQNIVGELDSDNDDGSNSNFDESDNDDNNVDDFPTINVLDQVSNITNKSNTDDGDDNHHGDDDNHHAHRKGNRRGLFGRLRRPSKLVQ